MVVVVVVVVVVVRADRKDKIMYVGEGKLLHFFFFFPFSKTCEIKQNV